MRSRWSLAITATLAAAGAMFAVSAIPRLRHDELTAVVKGSANGETEPGRH
jgi:hypothetical protein